jgi:dimethylargininase
MRPGAQSRAGEVEAILPALQRFFPAMPAIEAPGTVDGGDICEAGEHFFLGLSHRTTEEGARQLAARLRELGYLIEMNGESMRKKNKNSASDSIGGRS